MLAFRCGCLYSKRICNEKYTKMEIYNVRSYNSSSRSNEGQLLFSREYSLRASLVSKLIGLYLLVDEIIMFLICLSQSSKLLWPKSGCHGNIKGPHELTYIIN